MEKKKRPQRGRRVGAFFSDGPAGPIYISHRDHPSKADVRTRIESLWERYRPYCPDRHFLPDARSHFVERTWEMYLACSFLEAGFKLERPPPKAPDILTIVGGRRLWIEAVAPGSGDGPDAVPGRDGRGHSIQAGVWMGQPPPEEAVVLRCTGAVQAKLKQWCKYVSDGVVASTDGLAVAVSLAGIEDADLTSPDVPLILKALFPIGPSYISVAVGVPEARPRMGVRYRDAVAKRSGRKIETTLFRSAEAKSLVGVFYTEVGIWNAPVRTGGDVSFIHNPYATAPLQPGAFPFTREEWIPSPENPEGAITRYERT